MPIHDHKTRTMLWMLVEGDYLSLLPWQDSIEAINQGESKTNCIGTHTKADTKASKYGVRSGWWKAKRQNPKSSMLLRVGKVQKSKCQSGDHYKHGRMWNSHTR